MDHPDNTISGLHGLASDSIPGLQKQFGLNRVSGRGNLRLMAILRDLVTEPMFLLLVIACVLYFLLGESREGFIMLLAILFVSAISVYQEIKSTRALETLRQYSEPRVKVIRDGLEQSILSEELVPGDIMILEEGNRVPADARLLRQNDFTVNESVLTGESFPVEKTTEEEASNVYHGTTVNSGKAYARVVATGINTRLAILGKTIETIADSRTELQNQVNRFVRGMALFGILAFLLIWIINYLESKNLVESLLFGLTLAMSAVPEEIPVAFTSFMALGAYHMARQGIISRQPKTIENLGAVSVICLDKTGTITENKMQLKEIYDFEQDNTYHLPQTESLRKNTVLWHARLASEQRPFDSMEKAIEEAFEKSVGPGATLIPEILHEYPLSGHPPMMTHIYHMEGRLIVAAKGAPERILRVCGVDGKRAEDIWKKIRETAARGYRILGICGTTHEGDFPENQDVFKWKFLGFIALYDPPKPGIGEVLGQWAQAGIRIKIITGDYAETTLNIARQIYLPGNMEYIDGQRVMTMNESELKQAVKEKELFVRMFPEAKLKVIDALKSTGNIVAMTGDGVNDGPALKSSHIGIAMGKKGTDIAREAADLVITDDDLGKITEAIRQGRKIYSNFKKAIRYIISIHIPIILTASLPLLLGWKYPNIFTPIHIIFLELIMGPTCSIFYEREPVEQNIMQNPPRGKTNGIFSGGEMLISIVQGIVITLGTLILYYFLMSAGYDINYTRTVVFCTLIASNLVLTFVNRSFEMNLATTFRYKNNLAPFIVIISLFFLAAILYLPFLQQLFRLSRISSLHLAISLLTAIAVTGWFELYKTDLFRPMKRYAERKKRMQ